MQRIQWKRPPRWTGSGTFVMAAETEDLGLVQPENEMASSAPNSSLPSTCQEKMKPVSSQLYMAGGQKEKLINRNKRVSDWI